MRSRTAAAHRPPPRMSAWRGSALPTRTASAERSRRPQVGNQRGVCAEGGAATIAAAPQPSGLRLRNDGRAPSAEPITPVKPALRPTLTSRRIGHNPLSELRQWHGWTIDMYREAFGLLRVDATCSRGVSRTLARHARARHADGILKPGRGYAAPPGSPGRAVRPTESLGALHPELVAELDPERAHEVDPFCLGPRSGRKLWWRCPECDHTWSAAPHERVIGGGCPVCAVARRAEANRQVSHERSLAAKRPELLRELHPTRNAALDPTKLGAGSGQKVWWHCPECGHDWKADPTTRARGRGCPACARRRQARLASQQRSIVPRERSIAVLRPELASEIHPTRNGDLNPFTTAAYSNRPLWWLCSTCGNVWKQAPYARWKPGRCPACRA
jgi:rubrerythrin